MQQTIDARFNAALTATSGGIGPTEEQQTLDAAVNQRLTATTNSMLFQTATAGVQATVQSRIDEIQTATAQVMRATLTAGYDQITVDHAANLAQVAELDGRTTDATGVALAF